MFASASNEWVFVLANNAYHNGDWRTGLLKGTVKGVMGQILLRGAKGMSQA
jgi:hypothetical protein